MKIYLACPYTHSRYYTTEYRVRVATNYAGKLINDGHLVYSPLTHCHPIAIAYGLPGDVEFWWPLNKSMIDWCEEVFVMCLEGWDRSAGIKRELEYAKGEGHKHISYVCLKEGLPQVCEEPEVPYYASTR